MQQRDKPLTIARDPQQDLFICDVVDAPLKDIVQQMEHPFYSLSKKPETAIRRYEHNGNVLEVVPSVKGLATIYDKDILVYCVSKLMDAVKRGEELTRTIRMSGYEFLKFTNRGTAGKDYAALEDSLMRLSGTRIKTNIKTGAHIQTKIFGLVDAGGFERVDGIGRLVSVEITLSDWVLNAIKANEVLTLHADYFRLRKPIDKRVYELARKHCGYQEAWQISLGVLLKKTGSKMPVRNFRATIKSLAKHNHLPGYSVRFDGARDMVFFFRRENNQPAAAAANMTDTVDVRPHLQTSTYDKAKKAAPGLDVYFLEQEWLAFWHASGSPELQSADGAFIAFCKKRYQADSA